MGLFDIFKKNKGTENLVDEKKLEEIARYQAKEHQVIENLRLKALGKVDSYIEGTVYCKLSNSNIDVSSHCFKAWPVWFCLRFFSVFSRMIPSLIALMNRTRFCVALPLSLAAVSVL